MPRSCSKGFTLPLLFLAVALFTTASHGDELPTPDQPSLDLPANNLPTLDQLIEATPNIDTSDPETKSFRFTAEVNSPPHNFETTIAWQRDKLAGMRVLVGKDRYPGYFISNDQMRLYDVCQGRMYKLPPFHPQFSVRLGEGKLITNYGLHGQFEDEPAKPIVLELKSLIREDRARAQVLPGKAGFVWVFLASTEADENDGANGGILAAYEPQAPFRLRRLEVYPVKHQPPGLRISDISYNEEADLVWPEAPADELLPTGVEMVDLSSFENFTLQLAPQIYVAYTSVFPVACGLDHEVVRGDERLAGVDWEKARRFATEVGPEVRRLWR